MAMPIAANCDRPEPFRRSRSRFQRFRLAIARWRVRNQRFEQMMGGMCNLIDGAVECVLICFRRFGESTQLANELQR
jgi:hypothetical protein